MPEKYRCVGNGDVHEKSAIAKYALLNSFLYFFFSFNISDIVKSDIKRYLRWLIG